MWTLQQLLDRFGPWACREPYLRQLADLAERTGNLINAAPEVQSSIQQLRSGLELGSVEPTVLSGRAVLTLQGLLIPGRVPYWMQGFATSTEQAAMEFLSARENPDVREIHLRCSSPGGSAFGPGELSDLIYQSRGRKPIIGWGVNGPVCSAAYVILSACDEIRLTTSCIAGSIGVIMALADVTKADEEFGVRYSLLRYPPDKALGHPHEPLTDAARDKLMQTEIMPIYREMVSRIGRNRGVSAEEVEREFGGGLDFTGAAAVRARLADRIADWNEFLAELSGKDSRGQTYRVTLQGKAAMKWTLKMKAMLFAAGLTDSGDADDAVCQTVLRAWCAARGVEQPGDEEALISMFRPGALPQAHTLPNTPAPPVPGAGQTDPGAGKSPSVDPQLIAAAVQQALAAERTRQAEIRLSAELLGIDAAHPLLTAAMDNPVTTPAVFSHQVVGHLREQNQPVGRVQAGQASLDRFSRAAVDALLLRAGPDLRAAAEAAGAQNVQDPSVRTAHTAAVREVAGLSLYQMAEEAVRLCGVRPRDRSPESVAEAFLSMAPREKTRFAAGNPRIDGGILAADPLHGAGDYPNLVAGLANAVVTWALNAAPVTYMEWGYRFDDLPDFNARQILQMSGVQEFPERQDGREVEQTRFVESNAWIQRETYARGLMLTPKMVVGGLMSEFVRGLVNLQLGHERTINRLLINLLQGNPVLAIDGVALFNAGAHFNVIAGGVGGGPSVAQLNTMRMMMAQQLGIGDTEESGLQLAYALHGSNWINEAEIYLDPRWRNSLVVATGVAEADVNIHAGRIKPLYEPMLGQQTLWYGIANKMQMLGGIYAFGTGYGPGGRRYTYFKPETQAQHYDFEGSFGGAIVNFQPFLSNAGV